MSIKIFQVQDVVIVCKGIMPDSISELNLLTLDPEMFQLYCHLISIKSSINI